MNEKRKGTKGERSLGIPLKKGGREPTVQECSWNSRIEEEILQAVSLECPVFKIV